MREVLMPRRFGRLVRDLADNESERSDKWNKWPDLVLIDGGPSQMDAAYAALAEAWASADVTIVGMAKKSIERESGRRHFCRPGQPAVPPGRQKPGSLFPAAIAR